LADLAWEQWNLLLKTAAHDNWDGTAFWTLRTTRYQMVSRLANEDPARAADFLESYMMTFLKTNTSMTPRSYLSYHARIEALRFEVSMAEGDSDAAIAHLRRGMAAQPGNTSQVIAAVERLREAGRKEVADDLYASLAEPFERAVKRFPKSAQFHNTLADLRFRTGDRERAIALAKRCLELEPDSAVYQSQLQRFSSGGEPDAEPSSTPD
jgi:tetratricopeptide (TPR) repeat protein